MARQPWRIVLFAERATTLTEGNAVVGNLFDVHEIALAEERFEDLLADESFRVERIVSRGHATADGEWYDQDTDEWVVLLSGVARVRFQDGEIESELELHPGDYLNIAAHRRHRVEWTDPDQNTVWLAIHYQATR